MMPKIGEALAEYVVESVSAEAMKKWAVFLADPNPIHLDERAVIEKGLGDRVINQGPANVAYLINLLMRAFPGGMLKKIETRFVDNAFAGDRLIAGGSITEVEDDRVTCEIWLRADGRDIVVAGRATLELRVPE